MNVNYKQFLCAGAPCLLVWFVVQIVGVALFYLMVVFESVTLLLCQGVGAVVAKGGVVISVVTLLLLLLLLPAIALDVLVLLTSKKLI